MSLKKERPGKSAATDARPENLKRNNPNICSAYRQANQTSDCILYLNKSMEGAA